MADLCTDCGIKAEDFLDSTMKGVNLTCDELLFMLNDALELMWVDTVDLRNNWVYEKIPGSGILEISTQAPIYKIDGFYAKGTTCKPGVLKELDEANGCSCPCNEYKWMVSFDVGNAPTEELLPGQYHFCRDGKEKKLSVNIPCCVNEVFVKYMKGFVRLTDLSECLPVSSRLFPALRLIMKAFYADESGASFAGDDSKYFAQYEKYIEKIKMHDIPETRYVEHQDGLL